MLHSSPMPLTVALDMTKRLNHELARFATPEQQRDFARLEKLIVEAQKRHQQEMNVTRAAAVAPQPVPGTQRKSFWSRLGFGVSS